MKFTIVFEVGQYDSGGIEMETVEAESMDTAIDAWVAARPQIGHVGPAYAFEGEPVDFTDRCRERERQILDEQAAAKAKAALDAERGQYERLRAKFDPR